MKKIFLFLIAMMIAEFSVSSEPQGYFPYLTNASIMIGAVRIRLPSEAGIAVHI